MVKLEVFSLSPVLKTFISRGKCFAYKDVCAAHACQVLLEVKEVTGAPQTGGTDAGAPCGCWELNLREPGVLLVSESSCQTPEGLSLEDSPQNCV